MAEVTESVESTKKTKPLRKRPGVLFVCMANICRSPMAAALFRYHLKKEREDWNRWRIASAGTWAMEGEMAAQNSRLVMSQRGLDIGDHRARIVTADMLEQYDLILTMEPGQKEALQVEFPAVAARVFMLSEMAGELTAIKDPYGGPLEGYYKTVEKLEHFITQGMARILELVDARH